MDKLSVNVFGFNELEGDHIINGFDGFGPEELIEIERQLLNMLKYVHTSMYKAGM